jgi:hypothetical protein
MTLEEIEAAHPGLVDALVGHPGVGFVLVRTAADGGVVLGRHGRRIHATGEGVGEDPLDPFGPDAPEMVAHVDAFPTCADLMVNSTYDPVTEEVAAFEHQVSSHGGLGGPQTHPFLLSPTVLSAPPPAVHGSVAVHRVLKGWLREVGQPVTVRGEPISSAGEPISSAGEPVPGTAEREAGAGAPSAAGVGE